MRPALACLGCATRISMSWVGVVGILYEIQYHFLYEMVMVCVCGGRVLASKLFYDFCYVVALVLYYKMDI